MQIVAKIFYVFPFDFLFSNICKSCTCKWIDYWLRTVTKSLFTDWDLILIKFNIYFLIPYLLTRETLTRKTFLACAMRSRFYLSKLVRHLNLDTLTIASKWPNLSRFLSSLIKYKCFSILGKHITSSPRLTTYSSLSTAASTSSSTVSSGQSQTCIMEVFGMRKRKSV